VEFNEAITKNVEVLEPRARALAQDEISRAQALDQKTTGLIAAALVLVAAGVAFASHLNEVSAGTGARTLWGVLIVVLLVLLLASLGFATAVMHPQPFRVAIHKDELEKWATPRFLDRDPTRVLGELMQASVSAISEAREVNRTKGDRLAIAVRCFAAAVVATVALGSAVGVHLATSTTHDARRRHSAVRAGSPGRAGHPGSRTGTRLGRAHVRHPQAGRLDP
jgi:hypothetical protein